jgi:hypothetical protein
MKSASLKGRAVFSCEDKSECNLLAEEFLKKRCMMANLEGSFSRVSRVP